MSRTWALKVIGLAFFGLVLGPVACRKDAEPQGGDVQAYIPRKLFDEGLRLLGNSILSKEALPFQYAPDGCYARALLMGALLGAADVPSSQYYVYAAVGRSFKIPWKGTTVEWGYHVAPLMQPHSGLPQIFDPSVNGGSQETMTRAGWVKKFSGPSTLVSREVVTPGSCYVSDAIRSSPRPGCAQTNFAGVKLVQTMKDMPKFRVVDLTDACSILYTYLAGSKTGFSQDVVQKKRAELVNSAKTIVSQLGKHRYLEGSVDSFRCIELAD